ncbi:hypothetical protein NST41_33965 [Paenibacillus sp. FSL L8-0696]|uniref:hypothetical protein n=1 Tax=unclassified Paenibacillus TaxID=185978 RepID=UPI0030FA84F2
MSWEEISKEIQEKEEFIKSYILTHFGESVEDEMLAMSDALKTFYKLKGLHFGSEKETFILPDNLKR